MKTSKAKVPVKPKSNLKGLLIMLVLSLVLMAMVLANVSKSQDNQGSAKGKDTTKIVCKAPKVKVCNLRKNTCDCQDPAKPNNAVDCKNGTIRNLNGQKVCVVKCAKDHVFKQVGNSNDWGCVALPRCKSNQKYDSSSNTCLMNCKGGEYIVGSGDNKDCKKMCKSNETTVWNGSHTDFECKTVVESKCKSGFEINPNNGKCVEICKGTYEILNERTGKCELNCPAGTVASDNNKCVTKVTAPATACENLGKVWVVSGGVGQCTNKPFKNGVGCQLGTPKRDCGINERLGSQVCFESNESTLTNPIGIWSSCR